MFLAAQYYRPPFPNRRYWRDDFTRARDCGLHAVQLWCIWGWIEAEPGQFNYSDYDELMNFADKAGLKVVLSTIAEIHPFWIHRLAPGSEMVDHMGHKVISSCRGEVNVGLTPGGCLDHPRVQELMGNYLTNLASHYANAGHLLGWDIWNELRWSVQADGYVCYCPNTLAAFRRWLEARHGGLAGLNAAWQRRYVSWDDVMPGKAFPRPFVDMIEFQRFIMERASLHIKARAQAMRAGDANHLLSAHGAGPSIQCGGWPNAERALERGNDWSHAEHLDGYGCSHFPFWGDGFDETGFGIRVESTRSAAGGKVVWVSELQGGSARDGILAHRSVSAGPQQRWIANGMARGVKATIFWCWRDEVFGTESSGFGLAGWDGLASQRLAAMKKTAAFIDAHNDLIDAYQPDPARVGILFVPDNLLLKCAESGHAMDATDSLTGYAACLERLGLPYDFVEANHLDALDHLDVLFAPWALILPPAVQEALLKFIRRGGVLLTEAEADAYDPLGFYRYPDERPFLRALGLHDLGRRKMPPAAALNVQLDGQVVAVPTDNFHTPLSVADNAQVLAANDQQEPLLARLAVGQGAAYVAGAFLGRAYHQAPAEGFERLIEQVCLEAGVQRAFEIADTEGDAAGLQWRTGPAGTRRLLWIINSKAERTVTVQDATGQFGDAAEAWELTTGKCVPIFREAQQVSCEVTLPEGGFVVLQW